MHVAVAKGFVRADECAELNAWVYAAAARGLLRPSVMRTTSTVFGRRISTREASAELTYPPLVYDILRRIRLAVTLGDAPSVSHQGRDGVFVNCTYPGPGGHLAWHVDGRPQGKSILRCNFLTSAPEAGGTLYFRNGPLHLEAGDLHCYLGSDYEHAFDSVTGDRPRIMWVFGALVAPTDWETGKISLKEVV